MIQLRRALPEDSQHIASLVLLSAPGLLPEIFGPGIQRALVDLAAGCGTLFSHEHAWIAEQDAEVRGMLLGYSGAVKAAQDPRTGLALLGNLRSEITDIGRAVDPDDGECDVVPDPGCGLRRQKIAAGRLKEFQYCLIFE